MKKYIEIFKYSLKTKLAFTVDYIFSLFAFGIHIFVFNQLWEYILQGKLAAGYSKTQLIWYIIIAEVVVYSSYRTYRKIAEMIRNGTIVNILIKPIDFVYYQIAEDTSILIKFIINIMFAIFLGIVFAGPISINIAVIFMTIISLIISVMMNILIQLILGLLAFYTEENNSFWLIAQKLMFFAVFTPIEFYPSIVQKILLILPITYTVYAPAKIFVNFNVSQDLLIIFAQVISCGILFGIVRLLYKKGVEKINVNGG